MGLSLFPQQYTLYESTHKHTHWTCLSLYWYVAGTMVELSNGRSGPPLSLSQLSETLYFSSRSCCPPKEVIGLLSQLHPLSLLSGWSNRVQLRHRWGIVGVLTNMAPLPTTPPPHTPIHTHTHTHRQKHHAFPCGKVDQVFEKSPSDR